MSIENPTNLENSEDPDGLTPEQRKIADNFDGFFPNRPLPGERIHDCEAEIIIFNMLIAEFREKHSLEELISITDLTPAEAPLHPVREPARVDLIPIVFALDALKAKTNISNFRYKELQQEYKVLFRAVGMINNNKVRHD